MAMAVVALNIISSVVLKLMAMRSPELLLIVLGVGFVLFLNMLRMIVWYFAHRSYPLSVFYPLTSLLFPAMLFVALGFGEPVGYPQVGGAILISAGVALIGFHRETELQVEIV